MTINIGGDDVSEITIDGDTVTEITMDGDVVYSAGPDMIEGWEDQSFSAWTEGYQATDLSSQYTFNTSVPFNGDACLEDDHSDTNVHMYSNSGDGLDNYPSYPFRFRYYARSNQNDNGAIRGGFALHSSGDSFISAQFGFSGDVIHLRRWDSVSGGNTGFVEQTSVSPEFTADKWYYGELVWDDGTYGGNAGDMTWTVYDASDDTQLAQVSRNTTEWTQYEGVTVSLWSADSSHSGFHDYWHLY